MTYYNNPWFRNFVAILLIIAVPLALFLLPRPYESHPDTHQIPFPYLLNQPDDITCGPTSVAMVLNYHGKNTTVDEVQKFTKTRWFTYGDKNFGLTSPETIPPAMEKYNIRVKIHRGNLANIKHHVAQGRPVIVIVRTGTFYWHYVVVTGFTTTHLTIADPGGGAYQMENQDFLNCWAFTHDMAGNRCGIPCPACNGTGKLLYFPCDWCGGNRLIDPIRNTLLFAEVYPHTFIVED